MDKFDKQLDKFLRRQPTLGRGVYIATGAVVLGDVTLGDGSSIWYHAVLRGDINRIVVGDHTNIQDNSVLHFAVVGEQSLIGANALITPGTQIPPGSLVLGTPAKVVRKLTRQERSELKGWAQKYVRYAAYCLEHGINVSGPLRS